MNNDPRVKAGINMDGTFFGPEQNTGVTRPFLLFTNATRTDASDPSLASFLAASTGPTFNLVLANTQHEPSS